MGPLVKDGSLKALFIEVSYPEEVSNTALFGHFKPSLFMKEMNIFNEYSEGTLNKIKIYITHIKPCQDCEERIKTQLEAQNRLKLQLVFPKQGVLSKLY
jgi:3',5'-cyclic-nucleotide phosphodiesterase